MVHSPGLMERTDGMEWVTAWESTGHMGQAKWPRARGGSSPVGSFRGRTLDWRLERWETGWPTLHLCGTAEPMPVMTDSSGFADPCTGPRAPGLVPGPSAADATQLVSSSEVENVTASLASQG